MTGNPAPKRDRAEYMRTYRAKQKLEVERLRAIAAKFEQEKAE